MRGVHAVLIHRIQGAVNTKIMGTLADSLLVSAGRNIGIVAAIKANTTFTDSRSMKGSRQSASGAVDSSSWTNDFQCRSLNVARI